TEGTSRYTTPGDLTPGHLADADLQPRIGEHPSQLCRLPDAAFGGLDAQVPFHRVTTSLRIGSPGAGSPASTSPRCAGPRRGCTASWSTATGGRAVLAGPSSPCRPDTAMTHSS